jgi:hypothetical protein
MLSIITHPQALYQGTTSVVPSPSTEGGALAPVRPPEIVIPGRRGSCASIRNCHSDRSEAKRRNLLFPPASQKISGSPTSRI